MTIHIFSGEDLFTFSVLTGDIKIIELFYAPNQSRWKKSEMIFPMVFLLFLYQIGIQHYNSINQYRYQRILEEIIFVYCHLLRS